MTPAEWPAALTALPLGILFGVTLERAGLGDPAVIAGQFTGRDFSVVKVMFGAIVTAMLGVALLGAGGVIDPGAIAIPPTDLAAQAVGAVIFGGGFAIASLCPGTACVAAASGRRDGVAAVGGVFLGTLATPAIWPVVGTAAGVPREGATLASDLALPVGIVVLGITVLGVIAFRVARRFEGEGAGGAWWRVTTGEGVALTAAVAFALMGARAPLSPATREAIAAQIVHEEDHVEALQLGEWIRERRRGLRVIDVREDVGSDDYVIPGAELVSVTALEGLKVASGEHVVLYSEGGAHAAQAWVLLRTLGLRDVHVLKDGLAAWEDEVLSPSPPLVDSDSARQRFVQARALSLWFGGHPRLVPIRGGSTASPAHAPRSRRRRTC